MSTHQNFFDFNEILSTPTPTTPDTEELRPVVYEGTVYPAYSVSNLGNVYTHKVGRMIDRRRATPMPIRHEQGQVNGRGGASYVALNINGKSKTVTVHKLVMAAFRPMDQYPPIQIPIDDYNVCPQSVKHWIRKTAVINHIDHNCHNNHVDNLEYTTQHDNTLKAVQHHGGNLNLKNKKKKSV